MDNMSNNKIIRILQTLVIVLVGCVSPSYAQTLFVTRKDGDSLDSGNVNYQFHKRKERREIMANEKQLTETIDMLTGLVRLQNVSLSWMLVSLTHEKDEGMYSDEIKSAIAVKEIADTI